MERMKQLMAGKFSKALEEVFILKGKDLFPSPKEIELDCSCPDYAVMCKHVAAVLYGIGVRLDQDPALFFILRKAGVNDLVAETVRKSKKDLLNRDGKKSSRIIDEENQNLSDMFGIDIDMDGRYSSSPAKTKTEPADKVPVKPAKSRVGKAKPVSP